MVKLCFSSTVIILPIASPPKYLSATFFDTTIEYGSFKTVLLSPLINGNVNILKKEGSTARILFSEIILSSYL